jgi:hypothetical protein
MAIPANGSERFYTRKYLLPKLFQLYPEMKELDEWYLVGDALYDQDASFAWEILMKWGGHLVCSRSGRISGEFAWASTAGVPLCDDCQKPAAFDQAADWPTPRFRRDNGLAPAGEWVTNADGSPFDAARLRWKCASGKAGCRAPATYFRENPRLYTYLPHGGSHFRRTLRDVLVAYRNVIESGFAWADYLGFGGEDYERARWAGDEQVDHLGWMMAVSRTARKLVHQRGDYARALAEATHLGLLTPSSAERPGSGLEDRSDLEVAEMRLGFLDRAAVPEGAEDADGGRLDQLRLQARRRVAALRDEPEDELRVAA